MSCTCAVDNHGHTHQRLAITRLFTLLLALSISELPLLCQPEVLLKSRLLSLDYSSSDPSCLLMVYKFTTVRYHYVCMHCIGRGVTLRCNVAKIRRGTNAVQLKSQGRCNVTTQQPLSFFFAFYCIYFTWCVFVCWCYLYVSLGRGGSIIYLMPL